VYESQLLLILSNVIFSSLSSLLLLLLVSRSYISQGTPALLLFGCGILLWGAAGTAGPMMLAKSANFTISTHNILVWLSSLCHLGVVLFSLKQSRPFTSKWLTLTVAYLGVLGGIWLVIELVYQGLVPVFFIQGEGGTPVRQMLLSSAILNFTVAGSLLMVSHRNSQTAFVRWYSLSMGLIATGLFGVLLQSSHGSLLNWSARLAQLLGGAYMIVAGVASLRGTDGRAISLVAEDNWEENEFLVKLRQRSASGVLLRYSLALVLVILSFGVRLALEAWIGHGLPTYLMFYPAVMTVALIAGAGPGILATVISGMVVAYWMLPPDGFGIASPVDRLSLLIFSCMGIFMSMVAELYRRNREKAASSDHDKALYESRARLALFAKATFEGIVESEAGCIVDCNEQLASMLGYAVDELIGVEIASLIAPEDRDRVVISIVQGQESVIEHSLLKKDGSRIVVEAHGRTVFPGSSRRHTAIRNITDRKKVEKALLDSEELTRTTLQALSAHIAVIDRQGTIIAVNDAWMEFARGNDAGSATDVVPGANYCEACRRSADNEDRSAAEALEGIEAVLDGVMEHFALEYPCHSPQEQRWFLMTVVPYGSGNGAVISHSNITELKMSDRAIRVAKEEWERTFDTVPDMIAIMDTEHHITRVNKAMSDRLGLSPQQCIGQTCYFSVHGGDRPPEACPHSMAMLDSQTHESEIHIDSFGGTFMVTATPLVDDQGTVTGSIHIARDITERKRAEEILREREERLRLHMDNSPMAVLEWDRNFIVTRWTGEAERIFGWSSEDTIGTPLFDLKLIYEEDIPIVENTIAQLTDGESRHVVSTNRNYTRTGQIRYCTWYNSVLYDKLGAIISVQSKVIDITDLKRAETERQKFVSLADHSDEFIGICDMDLIPFYVNDAAMRVVGLSSLAEAVNTNVLDFFFPEDRAFIRDEFFPKVLKDGHGEVEIRFRHIVTGEPIWMIYSVFYIRNVEGLPVGLATVSRNISQRKKLEDELQHAYDVMELRVAERTEELEDSLKQLQNVIEERLLAVEALRKQEHILIQQNRHAAMGEMIGNIAHQWRQPLNTLGLLTQRLGVFYDSPKFNKEFLETSVKKSMEIIQYMSRTIDDFRNFFSTEREKTAFDVNEAINRALSLVEASFKERNIHIEKEIEPQLEIYGFPNEYSQVLLNILINAKDAVIENNIALPRIVIRACHENGMVVVTLGDNAGGIPEEIMDKIFDPYFTTKGPQQGTGIGLFMSKVIIENKMGGRLSVHNTENGAEFRIEV
jgi:PAS domain S-box-containing protein